MLWLSLTFAATETWTGSSDFSSGTLDSAVVSNSSVTLDAPSDWYESSWSHRTELTVTEGSATALTDYSVQLSLDTAAMVSAGTLNSDGSDLRFVDSSGTLLGHWVESGMNTSSTTIWVRVPSVPASGNATVYAYHGNGSASSVSDKSDAMLWWDDFSGGLSGYTSRGLNGNGNEVWSTSGGWAYNTNNIYSRASLLVSSISLSDDWLVETRAKTNDNDGIGVVGQVNSGGTQFYTGQSWHSTSSRSGVCRNVSEGNCVGTGNFTVSAGSTHIYRLTSTGGTLRMSLDGTLKSTYSDSSPLGAGRFGLFSSLNNPAGTFDYLLIRRYVSPEPTSTSGSTEAAIAPSGSWTSPVLGVSCLESTWDSVSFSSTTPSNTSVTVAVRSGPTSSPDGSWTSWSGELSSGSSPGVADGPYAQVRVTLSCSGCSTAPSLSSIELDYTLAEDLDSDGQDSEACEGTDCDDGDADTWLGADEFCDGHDDDCDGTVDEDDSVDAPTWFADQDGDAFGDPQSSNVSCTQVFGWVLDASDCDDGAVGIHPGAEETPYDGVDQDCSGADLCDVDGDGFDFDGAQCFGEDCDDQDEDISPEAKELWYDGVDQDCVGDSDYDSDGDGWDSASYGGQDCDDASAETWPGAPDEPYDGEVTDCDASDEFDADGDGFDSAEHGGDDCDDNNSAIHPGAEEIWYDGVDQDCDQVDDDQDGDGLVEGVDCDDTDPAPCEDSGLVADTGVVRGGGGCGCGGSAPVGGLLLGLMLLVSRRRR